MYICRKNPKSFLKNYMKNIQILYGYIYNHYTLMNMSINQEMNDFQH